MQEKQRTLSFICLKPRAILGDDCTPGRGIRDMMQTEANKPEGRRLNGSLGLSFNDRTIPFLEILLDKTVSVG